VTRERDEFGSETVSQTHTIASLKLQAVELQTRLATQVRFHVTELADWE
jgi:hypothetical protein